MGLYFKGRKTRILLSYILEIKQSVPVALSLQATPQQMDLLTDQARLNRQLLNAVSESIVAISKAHQNLLGFIKHSLLR